MVAVNIATWLDRKSTRLNSSHLVISYAVFCLQKKKKNRHTIALLREVHEARSLGHSHATPLSVSQRWTPHRLERTSVRLSVVVCFFFFNDGAPPEISPLPLPAALPI